MLIFKSLVFSDVQSKTSTIYLVLHFLAVMFISVYLL